MTSLARTQERPLCPSPVCPAPTCAHPLPAVTTPRGLTQEPPPPPSVPRTAWGSRPGLNSPAHTSPGASSGVPLCSRPHDPPWYCCQPRGSDTTMLLPARSSVEHPPPLSIHPGTCRALGISVFQEERIWRKPVVPKMKLQSL